MNQESGKQEFQPDPNEDTEGAAAVFCSKCGDAEDLTYQESHLWRLGLWPHRCSGCDELRYNGSFKELGEYMEGPE